ncbi:hypothetical protein QP028_05070 [Corynebacterium suedekumii]|nr:hypothetical protein QP028_05070 [Corynebacterium suedekumii]
MLALPDGRLLVGGDFKNVNGERRVGTVVVDPLSGEIDENWTLDITSRLASGIVSVTSLAPGGEFIYIGGNFTHLSNAVSGTTYSRGAARVHHDGTLTTLESGVQRDGRGYRYLTLRGPLLRGRVFHALRGQPRLESHRPDHCAGGRAGV